LFRMRNIPLSMWNSYQRSLRVRPLATKTAAAATIFFASDLATQRLTRDDGERDGSAADAAAEEGDDPAYFGGIDFRRALSGASFGVVGTVYLHHWWNFLERLVEARFPVGRRRMANTVAKVFIDQSLSAPLYYYAYYVITNYIKPSGVGVVGEGATTAKVEDLSHADRLSFAFGRASDMVWPTMLRHWRVWPPIHLVNFHYTPLQHRVLVQNLVLVGWSGYLSHLNHGKHDVEVEVEDKVDTAEAAVAEGRKTLKLKRRKTVITGLDVVEEEEEKAVVKR